MAKYTTLNALFTAIANSIRNKTGGNGKIIADDFPAAIDGISTGITPTGTKTVTVNGEYDITEFAKVNVNVPASGITPSGTKSITENGTFDVTNFASAVVNVPSNKVTMEVHEVTFDSDLNGSTAVDRTILSGNAFVKENYAKNGFAAMLVPVTPVPMTAQYVTHSIYHGNANIGASDKVQYGFAFQSNSASSLGFSGLTAKISGTNYNACFRARNTGNLNLYVGSNRIVKAGTYKIVLLCWE